jgi:hypothetical protein
MIVKRFLELNIIADGTHRVSQDNHLDKHTGVC